ncbi:branched-chain amino acid transport system permease protein [Variovorax sp. OAS795]|uniref:branched-chain amino acid ABC transporter permease n=1 Tax=Variovorax sp. OAS795 TaxID=3034231 RepID=UPI003398E110
MARYETGFEDGRRLLRGKQERLAYGLLAVALVAAPWVLPAYHIGEATFILIMCVASLGLMMLTGFTGQVSLGQSAFVGIGAYIHTILLTQGVPLPVSLLLTTAGAALGGLLVGMPAIRVSGLHLAMVTMAFAIVCEHVIGRWKSVTAGHSGMAVPDPTLFGLSLGGPRAFYFLCLVVLAVVLILLVNLMRSATGRAFIGIRDSEAAAQGLGIDVARTKVLAFSLSAACSGLAGALLAHQMQHITPEAFGLALSLQLVLMVFIGGLGSLRGAILGAILIGLLPSFISSLKEALPAKLGAQFGLELFVYGAVLTFFVLLEPGGLNARWVRIRKVLAEFPWVRKSSVHKTKVYMKSERYR